MRLKPLSQSGPFTFYAADTTMSLEIPLGQPAVSAGFPSPAEDYVDLKLDLNKHLVQHPAATFYVRVKGSSMQNAGINDNDMLIVDRSLEPKNNAIAVCVVNGEFTVKRLRKVKGDLFLMPENPSFKPLKVGADSGFEVWGMVAYIIHKT
jgi:DNA polymerase V